MNHLRVARRRVVATRAIGCSLGAAALLVGSAVAQDGGGDRVRQLEETVRQQTTVIEDLMRRLEQLERATATPPPSVPAPVSKPVAAPVTPPPPSPPGSSEQVREREVAEVPPAEAAPGEFDVDEEAIDRALERTLVEDGVLLLPYGRAEIVPRFGYTRQEREIPTGVSRDGEVLVGRGDVRRDEFEPSLGARLGLPYDTQLEIDLPYNIVSEERRTLVGFGVESADERTGSGFDDLRIGLAKTLTMEHGWRPDIVARLNWDTRSGVAIDNGVGLGGDFNSLRGSLSFVKREDPLAFVGGFSYETTFERDGIDPGDEVGFSIGTVLAASPDTSLRLGLAQSFTMERSIDDQDIDGSDQVEASLTLGAASVLWHGVFLNFNVAVGLTEESPDYAIQVALPIRFNLPWVP